VTEIEKFIEYIEKSKPFHNTRNLYQGNDDSSFLRKSNLKLYLEQMKVINPTTLLLGEAPGYKGCGNTGIAFTSERIIKTYNFFSNHKFLVSSDNHLESEISATIVWEEIIKRKTLPLLWNIFPFHPHKENNLKSNRTPNIEELEFGATILRKLLYIFEIENIIAVGRKAEEHIQELKINYHYVRHPANGGKNKFIAGYNNVISKK
jgi:hypothetical protein